MLKQPASLRIVTADLQSQSVAFTNYHVRRPNLYINMVDLPNNWLFHIRGEIVPIRDFLSVRRIGLVRLSEGESKPTFDNWNWLPSRPGIKNYTVLSV
jgi:hypothetical protein